MNQFDKWNQSKKNSKKYVKLGWIWIIIGIIIMWFTGQDKGLGYIIGILILLVGIIFDIKGVSQFNKIKKRFKIEVLKPLFESIVPGITYDPDQGLDASLVYEIEYIKKASRYHSEDYLSGEMNGVKFQSSDVKLEEMHPRHTKNGTQEYYVTYFLGRVFKFDFNKKFIGSLEVLEKQTPQSKTYHKVELESIQYNEIFKTFTSNDETAFYVLTPQMIEALIQLEDRHHGDIGLFFKGQYMYITIHNKLDTFDLKLFKDVDKSVIQTSKDDLLLIKDIVQALKLNEDIFIDLLSCK